MEKRKGILALDIDGTLVYNNEPLHPSLVRFLRTAYRDGWVVFFATGRTFLWSLEYLKGLAFPFFVAPYNGACTISFPENKKIFSAFMTTKDILSLSAFADEFGGVVYEAEGENRIFYTPKHFSLSLQTHLQKRRFSQKEAWEKIDSLQEIPSLNVASVRFFLPPLEAFMVSYIISSTLGFSAPTMKDAYDDSLRIVQVTAQKASKGQAVQALRSLYQGIPVVAAGNDVNDIDLLMLADIAIATFDAPGEVKSCAHLITHGSTPQAITKSLEEAVAEVSNRKRSIR
jgi:HAD superfamily hydrolase (TIGR01484 family)